jgi:ABC-type transport system involved in multi-copper enzyme maturation permease subunit
MDLYRLFFSKVFRIGLIVAFAVSFLIMALNLGLIELLKLVAESDPNTTTDGLEGLFPVIGWMNTGVDFADVVFTGTAGNTLCLFIACMLSANFISSEQSCGYFKNIAGQFPNRYLTVLSKFIVTCLINLIVLVIYVVVDSIFAPIFFGNYINSYNIGALFGGLALRLLIFFAINAVILFFCVLAKNQSIAMVIGAIFGIGVTSLVYFGINALISMLKIDNIDVSRIMPDGINGLISVSSLGNIVVEGIVSPLIFIAVFVFGAIMLVEKRDVK